MSESDKIAAQFEQAKGKAKETVGNVTDNKNLQAEGKLDQVKGEAKEAVEHVKDAVKDLFHKK